MDAETEAETLTDDDCQTHQNNGTSVFDHQLLWELHAVKIQHSHSSNETSVETLNNTVVIASNLSGIATLGEICDCEPTSEGDLKIQSLTCHSNFCDNYTSAELTDAALVKSETDIVMKDVACEHYFNHLGSALDDGSTSVCLPVQHTPVAECHNSVSAGQCDNDDRGQDQRYKDVSAGQCDTDERGQNQSHISVSVSAGQCDTDDHGQCQSHKAVSAGQCDSDDRGQDQSHKAVSAGQCDADDRSQDQSHKAVSAGQCDNDDRGQDQSHKAVSAGQCDTDDRGQDQSHKAVSAGQCDNDDRGQDQSHKAVSAGQCDTDDLGQNQSHNSVSAGQCDNDDHFQCQSHKAVSAGQCDSDDHGQSQSHKAVSAGRCDSDERGQGQSMPSSECRECYQVTAATISLGVLNSDTDLGRCFTMSHPDMHSSSNSLQDAFVQFLKKKQVSCTKLNCN